VQNFADHGLAQVPNVIPSEPELTPHRPYGSWWRLPGRHHTRAFWTKVWDGQRWLEDREAIEAILAISGDSPDLIPCSDMAANCSARQHDGGLVPFARFLLAEGVDLIDVEDLAVRWDATQYQPPRYEEGIRQTVRDLL
jgi:hypothetical protein